MSGESGDMITTTPNNPLSFSLSSAQIQSLALQPSSTELQTITELFQRHLEASEGSELVGLNPSCTEGLVAVARAGFRWLKMNGIFKKLVSLLSEDRVMWNTMWAAAMGIKAIQNFLKKGEISGPCHLHLLTAEEERSEIAGTGLWATIWQIIGVFFGKWIWDMIKGFMEKLFLGEVDGSVNVDLDEESRKTLLQLALLVTILIFLGVIALRITIMV